MWFATNFYAPRAWVADLAGPVVLKFRLGLGLVKKTTATSLTAVSDACILAKLLWEVVIAFSKITPPFD